MKLIRWGMFRKYFLFFFKFHIVYKLEYENFTALHKNIAESVVTFQCSPHLCQQSSSTFEKQQVLPPSKSCSLSSATTGTWYSSVPCHLQNSFLQAIFQRCKQMKNLNVWYLDCRMGTATLFTQILCAHLCVAWSFHGWAILQEYFLEKWMHKGKHSDFFVFCYSSQSSVLSPQVTTSQN